MEELSDANLSKLMEDMLQRLGLTECDVVFTDTTPVRRMADIAPGDMVATRREDGNLTVHTGIYVGNGEVVDLWGPDKQSAVISKRLYADFNYPSVGTVIVNFDKAFPKGATVELALAMAEHGAGVSYNGLLRNCQHFATFCRTGRCASPPHGLVVGRRHVFK